MSLKQRIWNWLVALDQFLFCCLMFGESYPNETASAAAWRLEQEGYWSGKLFRPLIDKLFFFDPDHCRTSYEALMAGKHMPPKLPEVTAKQ